MSWAEEQWWFGLEDLVIDAEEKSSRAEVLIKHGYWLQKNFVEIPLRSMTDRHLENCIKMINEGRLDRKWALPYLIKEKERRTRKMKELKFCWHDVNDTDEPVEGLNYICCNDEGEIYIAEFNGENAGRKAFAVYSPCFLLTYPSFWAELPELPF